MTAQRAGAFSIRPAGLADAEALCDFKRQIFAETEFLLQGLEDFEDQVEVERDLIGRFHHQSNSVLVLAVQPDGRVIGLCSIVGGHLWRTRHVGTISLGVLRAWWRCGVGRQLLQHIIRWAELNPLLEKLALQVHASNSAARSLYRSLDFEEEGCLRLEAKLGDGRDDLIPMGRMLARAPEHRSTGSRSLELRGADPSHPDLGDANLEGRDPRGLGRGRG